MIVTLEHINELKALITSIHDYHAVVNRQRIADTVFYREVQQATELEARSLSKASPEIIILIANIAATSPNLRSCDFSFNFLREHAPAVAKELAKSATLNTVFMAWNNLGKYAPETAFEFAKSRSICKIYIAAANQLEESHITAITHIFKDHNQVVDITRQNAPIVNLLKENEFVPLPTQLQDIVLEYMGTTHAEHIEWDGSNLAL